MDEQYWYVPVNFEGLENPIVLLSLQSPTNNCSIEYCYFYYDDNIEYMARYDAESGQMVQSDFKTSSFTGMTALFNYVSAALAENWGFNGLPNGGVEVDGNETLRRLPDF